MLFAKKSSKATVGKASRGFSSSQTALSLTVKRELIRLVWLAAAAVTLLALLSYAPNDPSWTTWSSRRDFQNWMGRSGSVAADLLFQVLGLASFALCTLLALLAFRPVPDDSAPKKVPLVHVLIFLTALSLWLQCFLPKEWMPWHLSNPGGLVGQGLGGLLFYAVGAHGAKLLGTLLLVASAIILFEWKVVSGTIAFFHQTAPAFLAKVQEQAKAQWAKVSDWKNVLPKPGIPIGIPTSTKLARPEAEGSPATPARKPAAEENGIALPVRSTVLSEDDEELLRMVNPRVPKTAKDKKPEIKAHRQNGEFQLPSLQLLSGKAESKTKTVDKNWYLEKGNILVQKLKDFGVEGEVVHISPGPVITVYEFKPASGVKIKEISNLSDDLTLALSVLSVRIVAPIPGKPVVGIEIPSPHRETVFFKDIVEETPFYDGDVRIPIVLGRLASGEPVVAGLATMPHLLVAGSTGTGKSVFINTLITSLLYRYSPQQLKLILVDPKMVELSMYENIPHLLLPVVVDSKKAALALRWTVDEMERRYTMMHQLGVRHLDAYNEKAAEMKPEEGEEPVHTFMPYIVVVIDEYADLMAVVPKDVELSIARLAQKARASGIHLVLATQRPSTDVVTGTIKANFPSRISFRVASAVDSKTILDRTGAERLLGNGDMLFHSAGLTSLKRVQGAFINDADLNRVVETLKAQGEPEYDERILQYQAAAEAAENGDSSDGGEEGGALYDQAVRLVTEKGEASISLIQRHLRIGYNRAATLIEQMEKEGVVAPSSGNSKRRQVLVNSF